MRMDQKFNKRTAQLIEIQNPHVKSDGIFALGMAVSFYSLPGEETGTLNLHLTPLEALAFAENLISCARLSLKNYPDMVKK